MLVRSSSTEKRPIPTENVLADEVSQEDGTLWELDVLVDEGVEVRDNFFLDSVKADLPDTDFSRWWIKRAGSAEKEQHEESKAVGFR